MRDEKEKIADSVDETIRLSRDVGITTIIAHLRPFIGFESEYRRALARIEEDVTLANVYFDMNPFDESAVPLDSFIPNDLRQIDRHALLEKMRDPAVAARITSAVPRFDAEQVVIFNTPEAPFLHGTSLADFAKNRELSVAKAVVPLMIATKLRGAIFYKNLSVEALERGLFSPRSLVASNSPSFDDGMDPMLKPKRSTRTFSEFLSRADRAGVPIEKAIMKISGLPAKILGIEDRGLVALGYAADLSLITKDREVRHVFVNGSGSVREGVVMKDQRRSGMALRKK